MCQREFKYSASRRREIQTAAGTYFAQGITFLFLDNYTGRLLQAHLPTRLGTHGGAWARSFPYNLSAAARPGAAGSSRAGPHAGRFLGPGRGGSSAGQPYPTGLPVRCSLGRTEARPGPALPARPGALLGGAGARPRRGGLRLQLGLQLGPAASPGAGAGRSRRRSGAEAAAGPGQAPRG